MLATVKAGDILEVIWVSLVAGILVTVAFSFVVLGLAKSAEATRLGRGGAVFAYGTLAVLAFGIFAFAVGYGVHIMLSK